MSVTSKPKPQGNRRRSAAPGPKRDTKRDTALAEVLADYAAAYALLDAGRLAGYAGKYIGIVNGAVVGAATDAAALRKEISRARAVHPERVAVIHVFDEALTQG